MGIFKNEKLVEVVEGSPNRSERMEELKNSHASAAAHEETKRVGVKPGTVRGPYNRKGGRPAKAEEPKVQSTEYFSPVIMGPVFRLPYQMAAASTKSNVWLLDEGQEKALCDSGTATLNAWCPEMSQKWAALTAFSLALIMVTAEKMVAYSAVVNARKQAQKKYEDEVKNSGGVVYNPEEEIRKQREAKNV